MKWYDKKNKSLRKIGGENYRNLRGETERAKGEKE